MNTVYLFSETKADLQTLAGLGVHSVRESRSATAIKVSQLKSVDDLMAAKYLLNHYKGLVVLDSSLTISLMPELFCQVTLWILTIQEAEIIFNRKLDSQEAIEQAATELLDRGVKNVVLKGTHDYWTNGHSSFWLTQKDKIDTKYEETRTVYSTAITALLALAYSLQDALVIATMYVHQAIRLSGAELYYGRFPESQADLPYLASAPLPFGPTSFKRAHHLGLYPLVDSSAWVARLLKLGVKTIQLRIKEKTSRLEYEIRDSIVLARKYQATLFINDYWELALKWGAQAVHLGQSDLDTADLNLLRKKGLLLGVSTHCYYEVARAHAISPSYIAIGPVYPTTSKEMEFDAQGLEKLQRWSRTLTYPLVAIGGINLQQISAIRETGVCGVALISAITQATDPEKATKQLLNLLS